MNHNPKFLENMAAFDQELYQTVGGLVDLAYAGEALDLKTKLLIAMACDVIAGAQAGVGNLSKKARSAGASEAEIQEALRIACYIGCVKAVSTASGVLD